MGITPPQMPRISSTMGMTPGIKVPRLSDAEARRVAMRHWNYEQAVLEVNAWFDGTDYEYKLPDKSYCLMPFGRYLKPPKF